MKRLSKRGLNRSNATYDDLILEFRKACEDYNVALEMYNQAIDNDIYTAIKRLQKAEKHFSEVYNKIKRYGGNVK